MGYYKTTVKQKICDKRLDLLWIILTTGSIIYHYQQSTNQNVEIQMLMELLMDHPIVIIKMVLFFALVFVYYTWRLFMRLYDDFMILANRLVKDSGPWPLQFVDFTLR